MKKKILIVVIIVLVLIQFFRPEKNISAQKSAADISNVYQTPDDVKVILDKACNDCHSNNTKYPWYFNIQPVAWWLDNHIREGKEELNFSEFAGYNAARQYRKMEEVKKLVEKKAMPISSYTIIHTDAKLTGEEIKTLTNWSESIRTEMKNKYPADSLVIKRPPRHS